MGFIQGPRSLIVPFPLPLAKEYRSRMAALSSEIATRCTPTSVGYVVRDASKDALQQRLEQKFAANEQTKRKMIRTLESRLIILSSHNQRQREGCRGEPNRRRRGCDRWGLGGASQVRAES